MAAKDSTNANDQYFLGLFERGTAGESFYRKALALDPKSFYARCGLALSELQEMNAQPDSAFPLLFEAVRMHPDHPYGYQALALAYEMSKDFETGIRVRELEEIVTPESFQPINYEIRDLQQAGRAAEGSARIEAFVKKHPKNRNALRALVQTYNGSNRGADAARVQIDLANIAKDDPDEAYEAATLLGSSADTLRAREWLKKAVDRGFDDDRRAGNDPQLSGVRADSNDFANIVAMMKVQHQKQIPARRAKVVASLINQPAPTFACKTLDGRDMKLEDLKGKVVVLDFWATWCGPCQLSLPLVQTVYKSVEGKAVQILCMNVWERDAERAKVAPFWKDKGFPMTVALASIDDAKNYGVTGIPTLFVLDEQGRMRYRHVGYAQFMDEEVLWVIDSLLAENHQ
jgi:thiol-disulfide isomerase/thioredoxin